MPLYSFKVYIFTSTVVEVGLLPLNRSVAENETFDICAEISIGHLGCNITVPLDVNVLQNTTVGKDIGQHAQQ